MGANGCDLIEKITTRIWTWTMMIKPEHRQRKKLISKQKTITEKTNGNSQSISNITSQMIAVRSFDAEAKYCPLCENCTNQTSSPCVSNI